MKKILLLLTSISNITSRRFSTRFFAFCFLIFSVSSYSAKENPQLPQSEENGIQISSDVTIVGESYYYADTISHIKRIEKTIIAKTSKKAKIKSNNADGKKATKGKEAKQLQTKTLRTLLYIKDAELQNDLLTRYKFGKFNTIVNCKKFSIKESSFQVNIEDGTFCLEKHKFLNKFFNLQTKVVQWFSLRAPPNYFI